MLSQTKVSDWNAMRIKGSIDRSFVYTLSGGTRARGVVGLERMGDIQSCDWVLKLEAVKGGLVIGLQTLPSMSKIVSHPSTNPCAPDWRIWCKVSNPILQISIIGFDPLSSMTCAARASTIRRCMMATSSPDDGIFRGTASNTSSKS